MSTMLEDPVTQNQPSHGTRLQAETTAARLHIRWPALARVSVVTRNCKRPARSTPTAARSLQRNVFSAHHTLRSAPSRQLRLRRVHCGRG